MTLAVNIAQSGSNNVTFRNRLINGGMAIDQRNAGAAVTVDGGAFYGVDRWKGEDGTDGVFTTQRTTTAPAGYSYSTKITITTADASLGATQYSYFGQVIEGYNFADLNWGTANAKTVTLSFWVQSSVTGTYTASFINVDQNRSYPATFVINAANTWEYKTITVAGDTTGTWNTTNDAGLKLYICMGTGSTYTGTGNAWSSSLYFNATGSVNLINTLNATFYITGVQLEAGSAASPFENRLYGTEFALCQRYYYLAQGGAARWGGNTSLVQYYPLYPVQMRTSATASLIGTVKADNYAGTDPTVSSIAAQATGGGYQAGNYVQLNMTGASGTVSTATGCNIYVNDNRYGIAFSAEL